MNTKTLLRKTRLGMLAAIAGMGMTQSVHAQVANYAFSQSSGSYTPVSGGTVIAKAGPNASWSILDDVSFPVTLPFSFNFNGVASTTAVINTNGWIGFGSVTATTAYSVIGGTQTGTGFIAGFNKDMDGRYQNTGNFTIGTNTILNCAGTAGMSVGDTITNGGFSNTAIPANTIVTAISGTTVTMSNNATVTTTAGQFADHSGVLSTQVVGTSPNRTFVVEWKNFSDYNTIGVVYNMQIRLAEGGGVATAQIITTSYGSQINPNTGSCQVGLRGTTNADYTDRTNTTSWATSTAGTSNFSAMNVSSTNLPASGLMFTFTPPNNCSGKPAAGTLSATTALACYNAPFTISRTGGSTNVNGLSYQLQSAPAGTGTFTNLATVLPYTVTAQTAATDYRLVVSCSFSGQKDTTVVLAIGQNVASNCYCIPQYTTGCAQLDNIDTFKLTGSQFTVINDNATGCGNTANGYDDRTAQTPVKLAQGTLHTGTMSSVFGTGESAKIWIDFNNNGIFDATDSVGAIGFVPNHQTMFGVQIPANAALGNHRMRVRLGWNTNVATMDPCSSIGFGEVHDYTVTIVSCPAPAVSLGIDTFLCPGKSYALNAGNAGSTFMYSNNVTTQADTITAAGTYQVTVTTSTGCIGRDTVVLNAATNPVVNLGNDTTLCPGTFIKLNAGNQGSTYLYSNNVTTQTNTVNTAAVYSVIVTSNHGCVGVDTITIFQGVSPTMNLGPDTSICAGFAYLLDAGNPGCTYFFSNNATTQTTVVTAPGTYSVTVTNATKCVTKDSVALSVMPMSSVNVISTNKAGTTVSFSSDAQNTSSYLWNFGDGATSTAPTPSHQYAVNGTYTVLLLTSNRCGYDTAVATVMITGVGVGSSPLLGTELNLFPNPANSSITLDYKSTSVHMQSAIILNAVGTLVFNADHFTSNKEEINISALPAGSYLVRVQTDAGSIVRRLQVVK